MSAPMQGLVLLGAEVVLLVLGLLVFAWRRSSALTRRDRVAMQALVAQVKQAKVGRESAIRQLLSERFKLAGDRLDASTTAMLREEMRLYQFFANLYAKRDAGAARDFNVALEAGLAPYWSLPEQRIEATDAQAAPGAVDVAEFERLMQENQDLRGELQVTMDTMARMLDEYARMFGLGMVEAVPALGEDGELAANAASVPAPIDNDLAIAGAESPGDAAPPGEPLTAEATAAGSDGARLSDELAAGLEPGPDDAAGDPSVGAALDAAPLSVPQPNPAEPAPLADRASDDGDAAPAISNADADALLAEALGSADLAAEELDDLFDDEDLDALGDGEARADRGDLGDDKSVLV